MTLAGKPGAALLLALSWGCSTAAPVAPPPDEHAEFDFLLRAGSASARPQPAPSFVSSLRPPASPFASALPPAVDPYAGCRSKMGSSLAVKLQSPASSQAKLNVTVEFVSEQDDDEVPGLGFVRPGVAVGALTLVAIAKLCQHPDLKWIDGTPTFMGGP